MQWGYEVGGGRWRSLIVGAITKEGEQGVTLQGAGSASHKLGGERVSVMPGTCVEG